MLLTTIFSGGFGSGKSEIALNYVRFLKQSQSSVILADLDLVNPYFASRDQRDLLEREGIQVAAPFGSLRFSDVPALPVDIIKLLYGKVPMVIDLAGDEAGATVFGSLQEKVKQRGEYEMLLVVNPYRPFAENLPNMREMLNILEQSARTSFTGIVSNPNLIEDTTTDVILEGHALVKEYARSFQLPIRMVTVEQSFVTQVAGKIQEKIFPIRPLLRPDYLKK